VCEPCHQYATQRSLAEVQRRNALSEQQATDLAVRAVREVCAELR